MGKLISLAFKTALGRWVTGITVALLLGGVALKWHNHKEGLREEGRIECVQEINQATIDELEQQLADKGAANAKLAEELDRANQENALALDRRRELETSLTALAAQIEEQRNNDESYREWSDTTLPGGVADRLREAAGSQAGSND